MLTHHLIEAMEENEVEIDTKEGLMMYSGLLLLSVMADIKLNNKSTRKQREQLKQRIRNRRAKKALRNFGGSPLRKKKGKKRVRFRSSAEVISLRIGSLADEPGIQV